MVLHCTSLAILNQCIVKKFEEFSSDDDQHVRVEIFKEFSSDDDQHVRVKIFWGRILFYLENTHTLFVFYYDVRRTLKGINFEKVNVFIHSFRSRMRGRKDGQSDRQKLRETKLNFSVMKKRNATVKNGRQTYEERCFELNIYNDENYISQAVCPCLEQ